MLVSFGGGLRWGETTALTRRDIDWRRGRIHVERTWSESGGRVERCKDGDDRWVTLPTSTLAALRAHGETMELEATLKQWTPEQRELVFPNTVGAAPSWGDMPYPTMEPDAPGAIERLTWLAQRPLDLRGRSRTPDPDDHAKRAPARQGRSKVFKC